MSDHIITPAELYNIFNSNYEISSLSKIDCEEIVKYFQQSNKNLKCTSLNKPVTIFFYNNNEKQILNNNDILTEYMQHLENIAKNKSGAEQSAIINTIEKFNRIICEDAVKESAFYNNIIRKEDRYENIFNSEHFEEPNNNSLKLTVNWNELNKNQKAAFITEYIDNSWNGKTIERFITNLNDNPDDFSKYCTNDIWDKIKNLKNDNKLHISYNMTKSNFDHVLEPRKYVLETFHDNKEKSEIFYSDNLNDIKSFLKTIKDNDKYFIHGEVYENNKTLNLLYELNSEHEIDYQNNQMKGIITPQYFTNLYNNTKKNLQIINETTSAFILDYLKEKNLFVIKPDFESDNLQFLNLKNHKITDTNIADIILKADYFTIEEKIKKIYENQKLLSEGKFNGLFISEGTLESDKKHNLFTNLLENYRCENITQWQKNNNKIEKLEEQNRYLSINNLSFENNLNSLNKKKNIPLLFLFAQKICNLPENQKDELLKETIKKAEQFNKINELTNHKGRK